MQLKDIVEEISKVNQYNQYVQGQNYIVCHVTSLLSCHCSPCTQYIQFKQELIRYETPRQSIKSIHIYCDDNKTN